MVFGWVGAISMSLHRLGVAYADALLMHHPAEESAASFAEQWAQMEAAAEVGKAKALGLAGHRLPWFTMHIGPMGQTSE